MKTFRLYLGRDIACAQKCVSDTEFQEFLQTAVDTRLDGYTIYPARGFWHGTAESSWVIEAFCDDESIVLAVAADYALRFRQNSVLVLEGYGHTRLVFRPDKAAVGDVSFAIAEDPFRGRECSGAQV